MSYYVAFPAHLLEELLAFLPDDERPLYAERFETIIGDLVWVRADAENAVTAAIQQLRTEEVQNEKSDHDEVSQETIHRIVEEIMEQEHGSLVTLAQSSLEQTARTLLEEYRKPESRNATGS